MFVRYKLNKKEMRYKSSDIRKYLTTKGIAFCVSLFLYCLAPLRGVCQTGETAVETLVEMGLKMSGGRKMRMNVFMFFKILRIVCKG